MFLTRIHYLAAAILLCFTCSAQTPGGIRVSVNRKVPVNPTQAKYLIAAETPADMGFQEVLTAIQRTGVSEANLIGALRYSGYGYPSLSEDAPVMYWSFELIGPASDVETTMQRLAVTAAEVAAATNSKVKVGGSVTEIGPSQAERERATRSVLSALFAEAKTKAEALAMAGGTRLGPITAIGEGNDIAAAIIGIPYGTARLVLTQDVYLSVCYAAGGGAADGTVMVPVQRPDTSAAQAVIVLALSSGRTTSLPQVVQLLGNLGVTPDDLNGARVVPAAEDPSGTDRVEYSFLKRVPLAQFGSYVSMVEQLRKQLPAPHALSFDVPGLASTPSEYESRRPAAWTEMIGDARRQAQELARAAGVELGEMLGALDTAPPERLSVYGDSRLVYSLNLRFAIRR